MTTLRTALLVKIAAASCLAMSVQAHAAELTGPAGGGQAFSNYQPSLVLNSYVTTTGIYPQRDGSNASDAVASLGMLGSIRTFAWSGELNGIPGIANGFVYNINQNMPLFSLLVNQYGGNGTSTFALPNLAGTTMIGVAPSFGGDARTQSGSPTVTLTTSQMPAHDHQLTDNGTPPGMTEMTGAGSAFDNRQPSLQVTYGVAVDAAYSTRGNAALLGEVTAFATTYVPAGYLAANGQLLQISENAALYSKFGTTFGGDGITTFGLPDLIGRFVVGVGTGINDTTAVALGQAVGQASTTLTIANLPAHDHDVAGSRDAVPAGSVTPTSIAQEQPSLGLRYLIATAGQYPFRDTNPGYDGTYIGEVITYAGADFSSDRYRGFVEAAGQLLNISQNVALYSLLGTTYGGDGRTTFALPDLRGRTIVGSGNLGGTYYSVGDQIGMSHTTLTAANLPVHDHELPAVAAAVPEPATWAMMLVGFGLIGVTARRRSSTEPYVVAGDRLRRRQR